MATLHGKKLSEKELLALQKKWKRADNKFWKEAKKKEIARMKAHIQKLKKLPKTALRDRLISKNESDLKSFSTIKMLKN